MPERSKWAEALDDLREGLRRWPLWTFHGWLEIKQRYRRSVLGPFWLTLSMAATVGALGLVYGTIFDTALADYLPYLALGFVMWGLWSNLLNDACMVFANMEGFVKQSRVPLSVYVFRTIWMNLIIFAHNFLVFVVVAAAFGLPFNAASLLFVPGVALLVANAFGWSLLLAVACARFRDIPPIVASGLQLAFFATPILFHSDLARGRAFIVDYNPFFYLIEAVRAPLLGQLPHPGTWAVMTALAVAANAAGLIAFALYRRRIAYWV